MDWIIIQPNCEMPNDKEIVFLKIRINGVSKVIESIYMNPKNYKDPRPGRALYDLPIYDDFFRPIFVSDQKEVANSFNIDIISWKRKNTATVYTVIKRVI